jgi:hypothetical protein
MLTLMSTRVDAGLREVGWDVNNDGVLECEKGDFSDPMGGASAMVRFNAVNRFGIGWINYAQLVQNPTGLLTLTSASVVSGTSTSTTLVQLTRSTLTDSFWVSLRTANGAYDNMLTSGWANTVYLHRWDPEAGSRITLVARLAAGKYVNFPAHDLSVSVISIDTTMSRTSIRVSGCTFQAPTVTISNVTRSNCLLITTSPVTMTITNNNIGCAKMPFLIEHAPLPLFWYLGTEEAASFTCVLIAVTIRPDEFPRETTWEVRLCRSHGCHVELAIHWIGQMVS